VVIPATGVWLDGTTLGLETDNIVASGGVLGGGVAVVGATFSLDPLASAGLLAAGSTRNVAVFNPSLPSNGAWASGSAATFGIEVGTIAPAGLLAGGSAVATGNVYNIVATGGAFGAGLAAYSASYSLSSPSAGVLGAGTSTTTGSVTATVAAVGLLATGTGSTSSRTTVATTPAGVMAAGLTDVQAQTSYSVVGGVVLGGSSDRSQKIYGRLMYHRFRIGDIVFVKSTVSDRYLQQSVRAAFTVNGADYYTVGLGTFPDGLLLSFEEYRAAMCRRALATVGRSAEALKRIRMACGE
jgi:hypothetical protein